MFENIPRRGAIHLLTTTFLVDSGVDDALNADNNPHDPSGHTDGADTTDTTSINANEEKHYLDAKDPSTHANFGAHHTTDATDTHDSSAHANSGAYHATDTTDMNDPSAHESGVHHATGTTDTHDPCLHVNFLDAIRANGVALLRQYGGIIQFSLKIDARLGTSGIANLIKASPEIHAQFCLDVLPLAKRHDQKLASELAIFQKIMISGNINSKDYIVSIMYKMIYSKIPRKDLESIVAQFGGGK